MLKLDNNLLDELGLGSLPEDQKRSMLQHIYETLELRVGTNLANQMSDQQLEEFEKFIDDGGDANQAQALQWLETNLPNYKQVVNEVFEALKGEIKQMAPQLVAASAAAPQPVQPAQPPVEPFMPPVAPVQPQPSFQAPAPQPPQPAQPYEPASPMQSPADYSYGTPAAQPSVPQPAPQTPQDPAMPPAQAWPPAPASDSQTPPAPQQPYQFPASQPPAGPGSYPPQSPGGPQPGQ